MKESVAIVVRAATSADAKVLGGFGAALIELHHEIDDKRFIAATARTPSIYAEYLERQANKKHVIVLVAEVMETVIGYVFARVEGPDYMALRGPLE